MTFPYPPMSPPGGGYIRRWRYLPAAATGTLPTLESACATGWYLSATCWRTCQLSTLILTTVELMSPVMRTQEARCHMPRGRHRRPITLTACVLTLHTRIPIPLPCPTELVPSSEVPSGPRRLLATYLRTNSRGTLLTSGENLSAHHLSLI